MFSQVQTIVKLLDRGYKPLANNNHQPVTPSQKKGIYHENQPTPRRLDISFMPQL